MVAEAFLFFRRDGPQPGLLFLVLDSRVPEIRDLHHLVPCNDVRPFVVLHRVYEDHVLHPAPGEDFVERTVSLVVFLLRRFRDSPASAEADALQAVLVVVPDHSVGV